MGEALLQQPPATPPEVPAPSPVAPSRREPAPEPKGPAASPAYKAYFEALHAEAMRCYAIAKQARRKGKDPSPEVEIPPAEDLAARVEAQVEVPGVAVRIRELSASASCRRSWASARARW
jgi:hypothetical protein